MNKQTHDASKCYALFYPHTNHNTGVDDDLGCYGKVMNEGWMNELTHPPAVRSVSQ